MKKCRLYSITFHLSHQVFYSERMLLLQFSSDLISGHRVSGPPGYYTYWQITLMYAQSVASPQSLTRLTE